MKRSRSEAAEEGTCAATIQRFLDATDCRIGGQIVDMRSRAQVSWAQEIIWGQKVDTLRGSMWSRLFPADPRVTLVPFPLDVFSADLASEHPAAEAMERKSLDRLSDYLLRAARRSDGGPYLFVVQVGTRIDKVALQAMGHEPGSGGHANAWILNTLTHELALYEPHGNVFFPRVVGSENAARRFMKHYEGGRQFVHLDLGVGRTRATSCAIQGLQSLYGLHDAMLNVGCPIDEPRRGLCTFWTTLVVFIWMHCPSQRLHDVETGIKRLPLGRAGLLLNNVMCWALQRLLTPDDQRRFPAPEEWLSRF